LKLEAGRILTPYDLVQKRSTGLIASGCFAVAFAGLLLSFTYCSQRGQAVFFTTSSPGHTYEVKLKGNKGRALLISNEVSVDVLKAGRPFSRTSGCIPQRIHLTSRLKLDIRTCAGEVKTWWSFIEKSTTTWG